RREEGLAAAYTNAGAALADAGQDALAIPLLQTSLGLEATPKTRANLAFSMFRTGKTSEAIAHLRLAINQRKGDARLHFALGTALAETGDLSGSLSNLSEAVRLAPQDFDARVNHFNVLLALGMWGPGIAAMDDAIARFPREILLQSTLAYTLATCPDATARNPSRAVALAEACAAATAGQNPEILDILAASYAAAGRHAEAVSTATRGIAAARALKVEDLAQELERRRDLYQSGKALHEAAPGPASAPAPPPR
ncbi:MAG: hypothetical protein ACT4PL_13070, partial [Phycisphaerales bacterium]